MVVDDSAVIRGFMTRALETDPDIDVVSSVSNGELAVKSASRNEIDVVVLDIEMPVMDGLTALPLILKARPGIKVIMASTLTRKNAAVSLQALSMGATDYIPKPSSARDVHSSDEFRHELVSKVKGLAAAPIRPAAREKEKFKFTPVNYDDADVVLRQFSPHRPSALAIASSTGGPPVLSALFEALKTAVEVPVFLTQHMPPTFTAILAENLQRVSGMACAEGKDGERVLPGHVYVAPGNFHMIVERDGKDAVIRIDDGPQENFCRPAADPMFRSIARVYGPNVLGVVLTGMGQDGMLGAREIVAAGGTLIAQDVSTSVVWGMPGAVAKDGLCSALLPGDDIAPKILNILKGAGR